MRINDENLLREMRKDTDKSKRVNSYKVKYMKFNGEYEELTFKQGYDASIDVHNPFFVRVYGSGNEGCIASGSGYGIENAYNTLITQLILYKTRAENERNSANLKLAQIHGIIRPETEDDVDFF